MKLRKIISGGQTGADQGGLMAASILGLETGGTAPKGYRTERGRQELLHIFYGLEEDDSPEYPPRTRKNVADSDATAVFGDAGSNGSRRTISEAKKQGKPVEIFRLEDYTDLKEQERFIRWLEEHKVEVLNVAGNRLSRNPRIDVRVRDFIVRAVRIARGRSMFEDT